MSVRDLEYYLDGVMDSVRVLQIHMNGIRRRLNVIESQIIPIRDMKIVRVTVNDNATLRLFSYMLSHRSKRAYALETIEKLADINGIASEILDCMTDKRSQRALAACAVLDKNEETSTIIYEFITKWEKEMIEEEKLQAEDETTSKVE